MNKERRAKINDIKCRLEKIKNDLSIILSDEEGAFESMPEGLQYSERGMNSEDSIDSMNEAMENIDNAIDNLDEIF